MGKRRVIYRILVGKPEEKRPLGRPRLRWECNIKMDLQEVRFVDVDWINVALGRDKWQAFANVVTNLQVS